jgi:OmpA-OmpF porin, OOP family
MIEAFARLRARAVLVGAITALGLSSVTSPAAAQLKDIRGARDNPIIKRYEGSVIIGYDFRKFNDYDLLLGPVLRTEPGSKELVKPTKTEHVEGQTTRILYLAPGGRSPLEILRNYEQELQANGFQILYRCSREKCGADDGWLGEYYLYKTERKLLNYPPDGAGRPAGQVSEYAFTGTKDQHYVAAKRSSPQGVVYASVYTALGQFDMHKETFDHALVLLDVIETKPMETRMVTVNASEMAKGLAATGHIALYGIYFDHDRTDIKPESAATLKEIAALMKQDPKLALFVVGHTDNVGGADYNMDLSRRRAASVVAALTSQHGIDAKRLNPAGVGLLAPVAPNDTEEGRKKNRRVELVKR